MTTEKEFARFTGREETKAYLHFKIPFTERIE